MGTYSSVFCTNASPTVIAPGVAIYVFAKYNLNRLPKAVAWLADHSFGTYLVHALVIEELHRNEFHVLTWDPIIGVPVVSVVVFAISLAISVLLSKLPVVGKYLV
jgi:surface polysaccharide O-acyltransferase-like enzyme